VSITFRCQYCHKEVKAPDTAGGKRGKCPFCGQGTYIPSPVAEEDLLPVAPLDEKEERLRQEQINALYQQERELIALGAKGPIEPLEEREDLTSADLHHFVINYCLEMARDNVEGAGVQLAKLRQFGALGLEAVDDLAGGKVHEPPLDALPKRVRASFLAELRAKLRA
jgi:hypothetical protein